MRGLPTAVVIAGCAAPVSSIANHPIAWMSRSRELCAAIPTQIDRAHGPPIFGVHYARGVRESETMNGTEHFAWDVVSPGELVAVGVETSGAVPIAMWLQTRFSVDELCHELALHLRDGGCSRSLPTGLLLVGDHEGARLTCVRLRPWPVSCETSRATR
jgi:hypothetical protein